VKPDNLYTLIEDRIDKEVQRATDDAKAQDQRDDSDTATKVDQGKIRKAIIDQLHSQMDTAIEERSYRFGTSQLHRDTDRQWDLIAAAVEDAIIKEFNLEGTQATRMRGRSKVAYRDEDREILRGIGSQASKQETDTIQTLNKLAGIHATQGNRLHNIHLRMKSEHLRTHTNSNDTKQHIENTFNAYREQAIRSLKITTPLQIHSENQALDHHQQQRQHLHNEIVSTAHQLDHIDINNIMHTSLVKKIAQSHTDTSKKLKAAARNEAIKLKRIANSDTTKGKGSRNISRYIDTNEAKPLMGVKRDRDTPDGGKKGELTIDPMQIDLIVQRAWNKSTTA